MKHLEVDLGQRRYPIHIGAGGLQQSALWRAAIRGRHVLVLSNTVVAPLYLDPVIAGLQGLTHSSLILEDGEQHKSFDNVSRVLAALAELGASRDATLITLGGGVIGDLGGFAAACWMRGIDFIQMPTTLLAMVDSSVGGKTGVNLPAGKNLVGAFHQPRAVLIDTATLASLPDREYLAGLAEVIKYGAIGDAAFLDSLERHAVALLDRDAEALDDAIAFSCRYKAGVVVRDERELGERALLNFGHTFGHAIEAEAGYGQVLHGEAVAIGMLLAARLSAKLGLAPIADAQGLEELLTRFGLPTRLPPGLDAQRLFDRMILDKKSISGKLRLILWRGIGQAEIADAVDDSAILELLRDEVAQAVELR
jgi:3-dehydroquinate synthase